MNFDGPPFFGTGDRRNPQKGRSTEANHPMGGESVVSKKLLYVNIKKIYQST